MTKEYLENILTEYGVAFTDSLADRLLKEFEQESCDNAISRQAAIDAFERFIHELGIEDEPYNYGEMALSVRNVPPVTPQPKTGTGHWIGDKAYPICPKCNCNIIEEYISCSDYAEMYKPMKYCPNCGVKMVEPQERRDKK